MWTDCAQNGISLPHLNFKLMKTTICILMLAASFACPAMAKSDWKGKVVNEKGEPLSYANVAVLSKTDSTVLCGTVTAEDGTYKIETKESEGIMMVALMGYQTLYLAPADGTVIKLVEDNSFLQNSVVTAVMPKTKLTAEGLQTGVRGSVLENAGTAEDVLAKTPGIVRKADENGEFEVLGRGVPQIYINGHKVTDKSELSRLQSNEIQSVEVISNPGAAYGASVSSVVRIRTVRRKGEGFGFSLNATESQAVDWKEGNSPTAAFNGNYRKNGLDIFGGVNYDKDSGRQISDIFCTSYNQSVIQNDGDLTLKYHYHNLGVNGGFNYQIADNHYIGAKVDWSRTLAFDIDRTTHNTIYKDGVLTDRVATMSTEQNGKNVPDKIGANLYYNGVLNNKLGIDFNFDYYYSGNSVEAVSNETSDVTTDADVKTWNDYDGHLYAAKLVFSYPIWTGKLSVGTEDTHTDRFDNYSIIGADIPCSANVVREGNEAFFGNYAFVLPKVGQFNAGVRYEHEHFKDRDKTDPNQSSSKSYGNWFPSVSYAGAFGPVQMMLSYSAKTQRPSYDRLSGGVNYISRYVYQSGNPHLQPEFHHLFSATAVWKFLTFTANYTRVNDAIMTWSTPYDENGVVFVKPRNIDTPYRSLAAYVSATPSIGIWQMNYIVGAMPQWLTINAPDGINPGAVKSMNFNDRVSVYGRFFNNFRFKGGWEFELGAEFLSKGNQENMRLQNNYFNLSSAVQKTLLKDGSLVIRLEGRDLLGTAHYDVNSDFGSHVISQTNDFARKSFKLSLRYVFNAAQSKYRGTGAGSDNKSRMK